MDSKRVYKKISTIFWFTLAIMPLIIALVAYIGQYFGGVPDSLNEPIETYYNDFSYYWLKGVAFGRNFTPSFINDMFESLQDLIDDALDYDFMTFCAWFVWVYFLELMVDFIVWFPRWMHDILDKGVGKID